MEGEKNGKGKGEESEVGEQVYQSITLQTLQSIKQTSLLTAASLHSDAASRAACDKERLF